MKRATIHTVGPGDIIGEHGQYAVNVPRVKAIVDALEEFDITIHWFSSLAWRPRCVRSHISLHMHICIMVTVGARDEM